MKIESKAIKDTSDLKIETPVILTRTNVQDIEPEVWLVTEILTVNMFKAVDIQTYSYYTSNYPEQWERKKREIEEIITLNAHKRNAVKVHLMENDPISDSISNKQQQAIHEDIKAIRAKTRKATEQERDR